MSHPKLSIRIDDTGQFNVNRIRCDMENNGLIVSDFSGRSGLEWPKGSHTYAVYASGLHLVGKVNGEIRTACADWSSERTPGPWGSDSLHPGRKLFSVYRGDLANPLQNDDFQNWPVELGAPWVDVDQDGIYDPLPHGPDHPEFIGDQVIWYVSNDGDSTSHILFYTAPLGIEVQTTVYGFNRRNVLGDIMFVKELIINKSDHVIDSMYVGLWSDPDLGSGEDDFVGCDSTLGMGICYNDGRDYVYETTIGSTPALGYDIFQGPMVPSPGDTAISFGQIHLNMKNLQMTSFVPFLNAAPNWDWSKTSEEVFNHIRGLRYDGKPYPIGATGNSHFVFPGDPLKDTSRNDDEYIYKDQLASGNIGFLMGSGPLTMAPGDSQEVVYGIFMASDGGPLRSYTKLKEVDQIAQHVYDSQFTNAPPPPVPEVHATAYADGAILTWDDLSEDYYVTDFVNLLPVPISIDTLWTTDILDSISIVTDTIISDLGDTTISTTYDTVFYYVQVIESIDTTFQGEPTHYTFEGYNVYQVDYPNDPNQKVKIATYDRINGIRDIYDDVYDQTRGDYVNVKVQEGSDSGIQRSIRITKDAFNGKPFQINREYYFGVSAYVQNPYGVPHTIESPLSIVTVRIERPTVWDYADTLGVYGSQIVADHIQGISNGKILVRVINPKELTGDEYSVTFQDYIVTEIDTAWVLNWTLTNTTTGEILIANNPIFGDRNLLTNENVGYYSVPITEGFQLTVNRSPIDLDWIGVTANASGPVDPPVDALAYWYFPSYLVANGNYTGQQATNDAVWFFNVGPMYGNDEKALKIWVFSISGGWLSDHRGIGALIPDDYEVRFTGKGKAIDYWGTGDVIDVPFEWWNVGDSKDPNDDYQLIPYVLDQDDNGEWNLQFGNQNADHGTSDGLDDPWTDRVYVLSPVDDTPGSLGYRNFIAGAVNGLSLPKWYSNPGDNDPGGPMDAWNVFSRMVFMLWDGGNVVTATSPADYIAESPEIGTIFYIRTNKPITPNDVFVFNTKSVKGKTLTYDPHKITVWPNPYFARNPEDLIYGGSRIIFSGLPESGRCKIRIFDLAGQIIRVVDHTNSGTQHYVWDLTNVYGKRISSGMYIAQIETGTGSQIIKLAVIQPDK